MLACSAVVYAVTGLGGAFDRELLSVFDALLVVVLGLVLYGMSARDPSTSPNWMDRIQLVAVGSALVLDVMVLGAMIARIGDVGFSPNRTAALGLNRYFNLARARFGYPYWSLSSWLKRQVKEAVKAIDRFEQALAADAAARGFDGVVCGHIHHPEMRMVGDVLYINDGDWVESCTALVEHADGRLELLDWAALNGLSFLTPRQRGALPPEIVAVGEAEAAA